MTIPSAVTFGTTLEHGVLYHIDDKRIHASIKVSDLFKEGRIVVFGGPAPFSRLDSEHAELYERSAEELKSLGVDNIVALYCQDAFVCQKFREEISGRVGSDHVRYYGDGDGFFMQAYGLGHDFTHQGLAVRSERWCAVVNDGKVEFVQHDDYQLIENTHPDKVIEFLKANSK